MSSSLRSIRTSTHSCVDIWPPGPSSALSGRSGETRARRTHRRRTSTDDDKRRRPLRGRVPLPDRNLTVNPTMINQRRRDVRHMPWPLRPGWTGTPHHDVNW